MVVFYGLRQDFAPRSAGGPSGLAGLKDRMQVTRPDEWQQAVGIDPATFYKTLTSDLPGTPQLRIELTGGGQGRFDLICRENGKEVFKAEDCYFMKPHKTLSIAAGRDTEVRTAPERKGQGLGKIFIDNLVKTAGAWGIEKINLLGGREDGAFFWSRQGWALDTGYPFRRFADDVRRNVEKYRDRLDPDQLAAVEVALESESPLANQEIAGLDGTLDGVPVGKKLLEGMSVRMTLDLTDPAHRAQLDRALSGVDTLRAAQKPLQSGPATPVAPPSRVPDPA